MKLKRMVIIFHDSGRSVWRRQRAGFSDAGQTDRAGLLVEPSRCLRASSATSWRGRSNNPCWWKTAPARVARWPLNTCCRNLPDNPLLLVTVTAAFTRCRMC